MTMNNDFCPRDCEHLSLTEADQSRLHTIRVRAHFCLKYNTRLYHLTAHPDLYKCKECFEENSNEIVAID